MWCDEVLYDQRGKGVLKIIKGRQIRHEPAKMFNLSFFCHHCIWNLIDRVCGRKFLHNVSGCIIPIVYQNCIQNLVGVDSGTGSFFLYCDTIRKQEMRYFKHREMGRVQHMPWSSQVLSLGHLLFFSLWLDYFVSSESLGNILASKLNAYFNLKGIKNLRKL